MIQLNTLKHPHALTITATHMCQHGQIMELLLLLDVTASKLYVKSTVRSCKSSQLPCDT